MMPPPLRLASADAARAEQTSRQRQRTAGGWSCGCARHSPSSARCEGIHKYAHNADFVFCLLRKRNDDEDALEEFYTLVTHVPVAPGAYKGLETQMAEDE